MALQNAMLLFEKFKAAFDNTSQLYKANDLLVELKIAMTQFSFLLPGQPTPNAQKELMLAREILELAALLSIRNKDEKGFERHIAQVKTYYNDYGVALPPSARQYMLLGLNLLRLLANNRMGEFHTELELIPTDYMENIYIKHPLELEQFIIEGNYNKVYRARSDVPATYYSFFMENLVKTIRGEIADCSAKAYNDLSLNDAKNFLLFDTIKEIIDFANTQDGWLVKENRIYFKEMQKPVLTSGKSYDNPNEQLVRDNLAYAKELERIV